VRTAHLLAGLAALAFSQAAAAQPPPAEAYGRLPAIGDAAISPDGTRLAISVGLQYRASEPDRDLTALRMVNIDTGAIEHTLAPPQANTFRWVGWADERRAIYYISATVRPGNLVPTTFPVPRGQLMEFWRTGVVSVDTGAARLLMQGREYWANIGLTRLLAPVEGDPGFGRMIAWGGLSLMTGAGATPHLAVFRVDLDRGTAKEVVSGNVQTRGYLLDERGELVARVEINERSNRWRLFTHDGGAERMILEDVSEMGLPLSLYGLLPDGRIAAVNPHADGARDTLLAIDRRTGESAPLYDARGSDVGTISDPWRHRIVGVRWIEDLPKQHFFEADLQATFDAVKTRFADGYAMLASWSRDRTRVLVFGEHADDAGAYYVYEPATQRLRAVGKLYPELTAPEHLGEKRAIQYRARDGTRIPAYLTLPVGVEPRGLPLVLLVHGGPHARDDFTFDWWASFLASRGYAVLQANYRGSTGYGYEWFDAGRGGWGDGVMQTDVEDGAAALARNGIADPRRTCIVGASYGGYSALAAAVLTPDRYACAISVNGLSDPVRMLNEAESGEYGGRGMTAEWWRRSMGDDMAHLRDITPVDRAGQARAPILLLHGAEDSVVPVRQSRVMADRLRGAGKNVRFVELRGDDHWLSSASTRTQMLREIETFLAEHVGRAPAQ
jgi:acetyl esterase/lipase